MNPTSANLRSRWEDADLCSRNSDGPLLSLAEPSLVRFFLTGETAALQTWLQTAAPGCRPAACGTHTPAPGGGAGGAAAPHACRGRFPS